MLNIIYYAIGLCKAVLTYREKCSIIKVRRVAPELCRISPLAKPALGLAVIKFKRDAPELCRISPSVKPALEKEVRKV